MSLKRISVLFLAMTMSILYAGTVGTIAGRVIDDKTGEGLPGVNVSILEKNNIGTSTDLEGDFFIGNLSVGLYSVRVSMMGYSPVTMENIRVIIDQTTRVTFRLKEQIIEGHEVVVVAERALVEKDVTVKKVVRSAEEIQNLPARDLTEMLTLQSGIIQIKGNQSIGGFEERGIEEIHVRGGRGAEIGYMIDGMYIENPIYGGIGKGSRLNKYAIREMESLTGVFTAEYGDAMSMIVNYITDSGGKNYRGKLTYETSNLGQLSSEQDRLRNSQKIVGSLSGPIIQGSDRLTFHISGDYTTGAYRVLKFDDKVFADGDPQNGNNNVNKVNWLDRVAGWRAFGFDDTWDVFSKLTWKISNQKELNFSYWAIDSKFQTYDRFYQFYEEGKNVNHKWSSLFAAEFRHQLSQKTYYTLRASRFTQEMKIQVENGDMDVDGYPDWVEYERNTEARGLHQGIDYKGECDIPFIENVLPGNARENLTDIEYIFEAYGEGCRPVDLYYFTRTETQALYNPNDYVSRDTIHLGFGESIILHAYDKILLKPSATNRAVPYNNGNLIIRLVELDYTADNGETKTWHYGDALTDYLQEGQFTSWDVMYFPDSTYNLRSAPPSGYTPEQVAAMYDSLYYTRYYEYFSAGSDRYRHYTKTVSDELRFDITSRVTKHHQLRGGIDVKRHLITFDEAQLPWLDEPYIEDYGQAGQNKNTGFKAFLYGTGEKSPMEISTYVQDKIEYPWMTINLGLRFDIQNSLDTSWIDPRNTSSGLEASKWKMLWSPRIGISHVITDKATFTFGYGRFYQNPTYRNIYMNDKLNLKSSSPLVGNAHAVAQRVSSYEFGLNWQFVDYWGLSLVGWSKDYSDLASTERVKAFPYSYSVVVPYDYGTARGLDMRLERRGGGAWGADIQYTLSRATSNRADAWEGYRSTDTQESMPKKEVLMSYDRTHDFTITGSYRFNEKNSPKVYGVYPLNKTNVSLTLMTVSGSPYTPYDINLKRPGATNSERMPWFIQTNLAVRKKFKLMGLDWSSGLIVRNLFNRANVVDIYEETGSPTDPGRDNTKLIEEGLRSSTYFDVPSNFSDPRQIDITFEAAF